ncbi:MAG: hypothetical protein CVU11_07940 [Bacteroidetes bacterium HGW-Bacteroidetes-6]|jgi:uncharacterized protein (DUF4213/DUF364 family)|nr:MAG: hypothetical protein CVU11_07940 [Bacteroidetes bacterium HGW-Bacteroidetes-6]
MILDSIFEKLGEEKAFAGYRIFSGEIYTAVEDEDGGIGISATPDIPKNDERAEQYMQKVILQARINARTNILNQDYSPADILHVGNLKPDENIAMAGFIHPVYFKLKEAGIAVKAFDFNKKSLELLPIEEMEQTIRQADVLITTGTAFSNGSLDNMVQWMQKKARLYVIGPSVPMCKLLFEIIPQLQGLFGSVVISNKLIEKIVAGAGTPHLHQELKKASLLR